MLSTPGAHTVFGRADSHATTPTACQIDVDDNAASVRMLDSNLRARASRF